MPKSKHRRKRGANARSAAQPGRQTRQSPPSRAELARYVARTPAAKRALDLAAANDVLDGDAASLKDLIRLLRVALEISPLCSAAYLELGRLLEERGESALPYFRAALDAVQLSEGGVRAEASLALLEAAGFYAIALHREGYLEEAVATLEPILPRAGKEEGRAIRYLLAPWLVELSCDEDAAALLARHPDDQGVEWGLYGALLAFRREGDVPESRALLRDALALEPAFARQLLEQALSRRARYATGPGAQDDDLAEPIADDLPPAPEGEPAGTGAPVAIWLDAWAVTAGAVEWLAEALGLPAPPVIERLTGDPF